MPPHCAFAPRRHQRISKPPKMSWKNWIWPSSCWNRCPTIRHSRMRPHPQTTRSRQDRKMRQSTQPHQRNRLMKKRHLTPKRYLRRPSRPCPRNPFRHRSARRNRFGNQASSYRPVREACPHRQWTFHLADPLINGRCSDVPRMPCDHIPGNPERAEHDQDKEYAKRLFFTSSVRHNHKYSERPVNRPYVANTRA